MGIVDQHIQEAQIKALSDKGERLVATFSVHKGMNLISYKKRSEEVIDQSTKDLFDERFAGLGAMIGPHFHHRDPKQIPKIDETLFPHFAPLKAKGVSEPFSHGIGRYAPWTIVKQDHSCIKAVLRGKDRWRGVLLKDLEGQDFTMEYEAKMLPQGLEIRLFVQSEKGSLMGLHTYYVLQNGQGVVLSKVKNVYNDHGVLKEFPESWKQNNDQSVLFHLDQDFDFGFFPEPNPTEGSIVLETGSKQIQVQYWSGNDDNSWQLWHPKGKSFVCIEPLSAKDPRNPKLTSSEIKILISVL